MSVPEEVGLAIAKIMKVVIPTRCARCWTTYIPGLSTSDECRWHPVTFPFQELIVKLTDSVGCMTATFTFILKLTPRTFFSVDLDKTSPTMPRHKKNKANITNNSNKNTATTTAKPKTTTTTTGSQQNNNGNSGGGGARRRYRRRGAVAVKSRVSTVPLSIVVYIQFLCGWHSRTGVQSLMCRMRVPAEVGVAIAKIMKVVIPTLCGRCWKIYIPGQTENPCRWHTGVLLPLLLFSVVSYVRNNKSGMMYDISLLNFSFDSRVGESTPTSLMIIGRP
ncbi:hypothetical protein Pelo_3180 [Pelomyxa schiedti]|nr:hypothetical protein Pelo_3180 [Pelomyxa schiedti]